MCGKSMGGILKIFMNTEGGKSEDNGKCKDLSLLFIQKQSLCSSSPSVVPGIAVENLFVSVPFVVIVIVSGILVLKVTSRLLRNFRF
jgi:hypothetical protein